MRTPDYSNSMLSDQTNSCLLGKTCNRLFLIFISAFEEKTPFLLGSTALRKNLYSTNNSNNLISSKIKLVVIMNKIIDILLFFGRMFGLFPKPNMITTKVKIKSLFQRQTLVRFRIKWFHPIVLYSLLFILFSVLATIDSFYTMLLPTISRIEEIPDDPNKENFDQIERQKQPAPHLRGIVAVTILLFFNNFVTDLLLRLGAIYMTNVSSKLVFIRIRNLMMEIQPPPPSSSSSSHMHSSQVMEVSTISTATMNGENAESEMKAREMDKQCRKDGMSFLKYILLSLLLVITFSGIQMWHIIQKEVMDRAAENSTTELASLTSASTLTLTRTFTPTIIFVNEKIQVCAQVFAGVIPIFSLMFSYLFIIFVGIQLIELYRDFCDEVTRRLDSMATELKKKEMKEKEIMEDRQRVNDYDNPAPGPGHGWQAHFEEFNYGVDTQPKRKLHPYPPPHPFAPHEYIPRFIPQPYPYHICDEDSKSSSKYWNHHHTQVHPHQPKHSVFMVAKIANSTMKWGARAKARCAGHSLKRMKGLDTNGNLLGPSDDSLEGIAPKFEELILIYDKYTQIAGYYTLVIVCSVTIQTVGNLAWMALESGRNNNGDHKCAIALLQCGIALSFILMIANFGEFFRSVIRRIRMKLHAHAVLKKDVGRRELDLINWITTWDFRFHASNLFAVDRALVPRVLGSVMISFLVILQLQILDR